MRHKFFWALAMFFGGALLISNVIANKLVVIGPLTVAGASLIFPFTYWVDDVLTEVYGYAAARRVIWAGFALQVAAVGAIALAIALPGAIPAQAAAFDAALALTFWIVAGSLVAYAIGEFANSYVLARLKVATRGRWLWSRAISSTLIGQALDSLVFVGVAFGFGTWQQGHALPLGTLWHICWSIYVVKVAVEVVCTPVTYWLCAALKAAEGVDHYDTATDFSPFVLEGA